MDASALGTYDPRLDLSRYVFPTLDLLKAYDSGSMEINRDELAENQRLIKQALEDFNIKIASIKEQSDLRLRFMRLYPRRVSVFLRSRTWRMISP